VKRGGLVCSLLLIGAVTAAAADQRVLPARDEPRHKVVLENNYVRVIDVQIPAGKETLYHVHDIASVIVYLTKSTNESQTRGESTWTPRTIGPGDSRYAPYDVKPLTHRVRNPGPGLFRVYDIELLHAPLTAANFGLPDTPALRARWQEKAVRSLTLRLDAGGHRTFPPGDCAILLVGISGAPTVSSSDGVNRELRAQDFLFQPARTGFLVANGGNDASETVVLELK
jgi:hypothetical protein